ncbi:hypothetical protein BDV18DRAFT_127015 [Aspergillus unguis]
MARSFAFLYFSTIAMGCFLLVFYLIHHLRSTPPIDGLFVHHATPGRYHRISEQSVSEWISKDKLLSLSSRSWP